MSLEKDAPIGLSLPANRPFPTHQTLDTIEDVNSVHSLTPTNTHQRLDNSSPISPFYDHSVTNLSLEATKSHSFAKNNSKQHVAVYESDIEACLTESKSNIISQKKTNNTSCSVWPGQKALKEAKLAEKRRKECWNPMRGLDKRTKFWIKIAIAAFIVGIAVAVGLGISKAVGGGIWQTPSP